MVLVVGFFFQSLCSSLLSKIKFINKLQERKKKIVRCNAVRIDCLYQGFHCVLLTCDIAIFTS